MVKLNAHFDGKVIVPDEPLNLPTNQKLRISVEAIDADQTVVEHFGTAKSKRVFGQQKGVITYIAPDFDAYLGDDFWGLSDPKHK